MDRERLGEVTAPSGTLTLLDPGHIGLFEEKEIASIPSVSIAGVPRDRALPVFGVRAGGGEFAACWDHVLVPLRDGEVTESVEVGDALVDFSRLMLIDEGASEHWAHSRSIDGKADLVLAGADAEALAKALGAQPLEDGLFGFRDLDTPEAMRYAIEAEATQDQSGWSVEVDYRPHSHHFYALEAARRSASSASTTVVAGARVCLFATTWPDGLVPVLLDVAADGTPVQIRIQLRTEASEDAMREG